MLLYVNIKRRQSIIKTLTLYFIDNWDNMCQLLKTLYTLNNVVLVSNNLDLDQAYKSLNS